MSAAAGTTDRLRIDGWRGKALLPVLIYSALVMSVLSTLGSPMIPTIARDQGVSLDAAQWILTVTLLIGAVSTPITGRLADGPYRKLTILGSLILVLIGSILAATSPNFAVLITGRALQGLGLGLVPLAISVARDCLPADKVRGGIAILSITTAAGAGLGYPITGLIAQEFDYRAGFWFAAIISVIAIALVATVVPTGSLRASHPLDLIGSVLLGTTLTALLLAISQGEVWGWGSATIVGLFIATIVLGAIWVWQALRTTHPLVDLRLMTNRSVLTADLVSLLMGVSLYAMSALINRYVQTPKGAGYGFHAGLIATGLMLAPLSIGSLLSTRTSRFLTGRFGPAQVLPIGSIIVGLDMLFIALERTSRWEIVVAMILLGLGIGTTFAAMPLLIIRAVPASETGSATSMNTVLRSVGGAIGSAASIALLTSYTPAGDVLPTDNGYTVTFVVGAVICLASAVVSVIMLPRTPVSGAGLQAPVLERIPATPVVEPQAQAQRG
ncbi:MAG TPA: MFS transporter [Thermomicrobiales bacterium]|nr:MFS transporter [Thermomicrobiales bacterium]